MHQYAFIARKVRSTFRGLPPYVPFQLPVLVPVQRRRRRAVLDCGRALCPPACLPPFPRSQGFNGFIRRLNPVVFENAFVIQGALLLARRRCC